MMTQNKIGNVMAHRSEEVSLQICMCTFILFEELSTIAIQLKALAGLIDCPGDRIPFPPSCLREGGQSV